MIRSSSWRISQLISGSRLPVGSSAMMSRGSWTRARAIAVRCCSPPDSCAGSCSAWAVRPDEGEHPIDRRPDLAGAACRSPRGRRRRSPGPSCVGSSLKSWKTMPILRRMLGTCAPRQAGQVVAVEDDLARRSRSSSRISSLMSVDLPAPDGPTRKTKSPSGTTRSTSRRATLPFGIGLGDVVQDEDRPVAVRRRRRIAPDGPGPAWPRSSRVGAADRGDRRRRRGSSAPPMGGDGGRRRSPVARIRDSGHGRGTREPRPPRLPPVGRDRQPREPSAGARRDREVAREVGERPVPAERATGSPRCRRPARGAPPRPVGARPGPRRA